MNDESILECDPKKFEWGHGQPVPRTCGALCVLAVGDRRPGVVNLGITKALTLGQVEVLIKTLSDLISEGQFCPSNEEV